MQTIESICMQELESDCKDLLSILKHFKRNKGCQETRGDAIKPDVRSFVR